MFKTVKVPAFNDNEVIAVTEVEMFDLCPVCNGPRGQKTSRFFWEGQKVFECDGWMNPCGHVDNYEQVKKESSLIQSYRKLMDDVYKNLLQQTQQPEFGELSPEDSNECANLIMHYLNSKLTDPAKTEKAGDIFQAGNGR